MKQLLCLAAALLLTACSSMPVSTMWKMRKTDPLSMDPAQVRLAVRAPERYAVPAEGVKLMLAVEREATDEYVAEEFVLESSATISSPYLISQQRDGYNIHTFWIERDDYERMRSFQRTARRWKEETPDDARGTMSISTMPCLTSGQPLERVLISSYIRMKPEEDFITLTKDVDMTKDYRGVEQHLKSCS